MGNLAIRFAGVDILIGVIEVEIIESEIRPRASLINFSKTSVYGLVVDYWILNMNLIISCQSRLIYELPTPRCHIWSEAGARAKPGKEARRN